MGDVGGTRTCKWVGGRWRREVVVLEDLRGDGTYVVLGGKMGVVGRVSGGSR